jgi:hypothetical protein
MWSRVEFTAKKISSTTTSYKSILNFLITLDKMVIASWKNRSKFTKPLIFLKNLKLKKKITTISL